MSLSAALSSATSSLRAIQTRLTVASSNIANADDVHYSAKTATQATRVTGGVGYGVDVTGIVSKVDANLVRSINGAASDNGAAQVFLAYIKSLSNSLGSVSSDSAGDSLANSLSNLQSTLDKLGTTPESATLKGQAVSDIDDAAANLRSAALQVQTLRGNADSGIADAVTAVNDALHQIDTLNRSIVAAKAAGKSTAALEDQRNSALQTVAEQLAVNSYTDATGAMKVFTGSGQILVGAEVHELSFTATDNIHSGTSYPGGLSGITVNGQDVTHALGSGAMSALVEVRDVTMPAVQTELDDLAKSLRDTVNAIANQGSAAPPPNTLTGSESTTAATALSASGTLRVAVTDSTGKVVGTQDFNLASYATVGDLVTALDGMAGMSATLDVSGHLVIKADSAGNGVALAGGTIGSENVSGYFGLNDVLVGKGASDLTVKSDLAASPTRFPVGTMSTSGTLAVGDSAVTTGSGKLAQTMADALRSAKLTDGAADLVSDVGSLLSTAKSRASAAETSLNTLVGTFSSKYGVNVDEENARIVELQNAYSASAQVISAVKVMFEALLGAVR